MESASELRLNPNIHIEWIEEEAIVVDADSDRLHYLNAQAALFLGLIAELGLRNAESELHQRFPEIPDLIDDLRSLREDFANRGILIDEDGAVSASESLHPGEGPIPEATGG